MQHLKDYRQKYYIILPLILFFIYYKLYTQTEKANEKQSLSQKGLTLILNTYSFFILVLFLFVVFFFFLSTQLIYSNIDQ